MIEIEEDGILFARLLIISKARDINLQEAVGTYTFSVVSNLMFAADGPCIMLPQEQFYFLKIYL